MKPSVPEPVHYRLDTGRGCRFVSVLVIILTLALGVVLLLWLRALERAHQASWHVWAATALAYGGGCLLSWRRWNLLPCGSLVWTGSLWRLLPSAKKQQPNGAQQNSASSGYLSCTLVLDLQSALLIRLHNMPAGLSACPSKMRWLWIYSASDRQHWHALRSAVIWGHTHTSDAGQWLQRRNTSS